MRFLSCAAVQCYWFVVVSVNTTTESSLLFSELIGVGFICKGRVNFRTESSRSSRKAPKKLLFEGLGRVYSSQT